MVERIFRNFNGQVFGSDNSLARQARLGLQAPGLVEHILFQLVSLIERVQTFTNDAVAGGASADTAARTLDFNVVLMSDFKNRGAGRSFDDQPFRTEHGMGQKN